MESCPCNSGEWRARMGGGILAEEKPLVRGPQENDLVGRIQPVGLVFDRCIGLSQDNHCLYLNHNSDVIK